MAIGDSSSLIFYKELDLPPRLARRGNGSAKPHLLMQLPHYTVRIRGTKIRDHICETPYLTTSSRRWLAAAANAAPK